MARADASTCASGRGQCRYHSLSIFFQLFADSCARSRKQWTSIVVEAMQTEVVACTRKLRTVNGSERVLTTRPRFAFNKSPNKLRCRCNKQEQKNKTCLYCERILNINSEFRNVWKSQCGLRSGSILRQNTTQCPGQDFNPDCLILRKGMENRRFKL